MKTCSKCKRSYSKSEYHKNISKKDGLQDQCKFCKKECHKKNAIKNIERAVKWNKENSERRKISIKKHNYKRRYGISVEYKQKLIDDQNGLCAICKNVLTTTHNVCVDHCHTTNKIRGILCRKCNLGIGHLNDSQDILKSAIKYLKKYQKSPQNLH